VSLGATAQSQEGFLLPVDAVVADPDGRFCVWRLDMAQMNVSDTQMRLPAGAGPSLVKDDDGVGMEFFSP
jgi:hypothetical protein